MLELALFPHPVYGLIGVVPLAGQVVADRFVETRIGQIVHTHRRLGIEAAQTLEVPPRAGFKPNEAIFNAVPNGGIITHVEMHMPLLA